MSNHPIIDDLQRRIVELERKVHAHGCVCPPGSEATCQGMMCPRRPFGNISSVAIAHAASRPYPKHPGAMCPGMTGAFDLKAGERFIYDIDGRRGWGDEFLPDGDALVCWDDGTYGIARWNHMSPEPPT